MLTARLLTVSPSMHCSGGGLLQGVPGPGGLLRGGEGVVSQHALRQTPPCEQNS